MKGKIVEMYVARLSAIWMAASIIFLGLAQVNALAAVSKSNTAEGVTRLPFYEVAPLPGALSISADGHTAVYIGTIGVVVLWSPADGKQLETLPVDGKQPSAVALSADGDRVAIGYADSRLIVWSRRERKVVHEFSGHFGVVSALAFSYDGQLLASGADDGTTQLWQLDTGRRLHVFDSQFGESDRGGTVVALGFSGDGRVLTVNEWYSRHYDVGRGATLWDVEEGIEISTRQVMPPNNDDIMRSGQTLGGGGWLLAYTGREGLMVERLDDCELPRKMPSGGFADTVTADPQGRWVAASGGSELTFFSMREQTQARSITLPSQAIAIVAHPDGQSVFALVNDSTQSAGNGSFIVGRSMFRVTGGAIYRVAVPAPLRRLQPMTVKPDATHCPPPVAKRAIQDFRLPDKPAELSVLARLVPTDKMVTEPHEEKPSRLNPPNELFFSQNGSLYALYNTYGDLRSGVAEWDPQSQRLVRSRFTSHSYDSTIRLRNGWGMWVYHRDDHSNSTTYLLNNILTNSTILRFGDEEIDVPVSSDRDTGRFYRIVSGHIERYHTDGHRLSDVAYVKQKPIALTLRNGQLAVLYTNSKVQVWDLPSGGTSKTFGPMTSWFMDGFNGCERSELALMALSSDGRFLQIPCSDPDNATDFPIYDLHSAKQITMGPLLAPFPLHANRGIVPYTRPHHLTVWDFDRAEIIAHLPRHRSRDKHSRYQPLRAAMSDDGRLVASASYDGSVRVWDIDARQLLGEARVGGPVTAIAFDSAGRQLAVGNEDGQLLVLQMPVQEEHEANN